MLNTFVINLDRCSGCQSCMTTCKYSNNLPLGTFFNRIINVERGSFPNVTQYWVPKACQQCENPACLTVCPTGATYRDEETGLVVVNAATCIGCQACMAACPFDARSLNEEDGTVWKCNLCRVYEGENEEPWCVHNCPCGARFYGDLDDPESTVSQELAKYNEEDIHTLADPDGVEPSVRYILTPRVAAWDETVQ